MKAGGGGQNARQRYLETKEQHLLGVGRMRGDAHLGFNMLIDPACEEEKEAWLVCLCACTQTNIFEPASDVCSLHAAAP